MKIIQLLLAAVAGLAAPLAWSCSPLLDHKFTSLQGQPVNLCAYANRPILVVNTASKCGYTGQFEKLEALNTSYEKRGLVVLGFPCNQFGGQDPGSADEIAQFCQRNYGVSFTMMEKIEELDSRIQIIERWRWMVVGGAIAIGYVVSHFLK